jgi:formate dehydrogenase subunit delta
MTVSDQKLIRMAEQISANLNYSDGIDVVAARVAEHINRFWDPRMRTALREYALSHADGLSPAVRLAAALLH